MNSVRAGFARSIISPPLPVQLAGHRGPRIAVDIADDLCARAFVLSFSDTLFAIVSVEIIWLPRRFVVYVRNLISRTSGIRPENVFVACTHTHSGPDTLDWYAFAPPVQKWWLEWLARTIASTAFIAARRLTPVEIGEGRASFSFAVNRRVKTDNSVYREPNPNGPVDSQLVVLTVSDYKGLIGGVVHAAMHPVVLDPEIIRISGDWCGQMVRSLEAIHGGIWLFLNGAAGDNNPRVWTGNSYDTMISLGEAAAEQAGIAISAASRSTVNEVLAQSKTASFKPQQHPYLSVEQARRIKEDGGLYIESQMLKIGEIALLGIPGECLFSTAYQIKAVYENALIVSYANDYIGYVASPSEYDEGGYEPAASMLSKEGAEQFGAFVLKAHVNYF
jgi:neutral ceramidase